MNKFHDFLKPRFFIYIGTHLLNITLILFLLCMIGSLYLGFFVAPVDFQQGEYFRIFHVHVSAAWIALLFYGFLATCSFIFLIYKHILIHVLAQAFAYMGCYFSMITLITGSLWGRPTWGTFWVWDARLTSVFILFLLYLSYLFFNKIQQANMKTMTHASILAILGFINIPIIKYSVQWWNTLHQAPSVTQNHISLDVSIYIPLILCFIAMLSYNIHGLILEMRIYILKRKMETYYL